MDNQDRVVIVGYTYPDDSRGYDFAVTRLDSQGRLDSSFDGDGRATINFGSAEDIGRSVVVDTLDRVIVVGYSNQGGMTGYDFAVARLDAQGQPDTAFDGDGRTTIDFGNTFDDGQSVAVDSQDRVVVAGYSIQGDMTGSNFAVARLDPQGQLDTAFGRDGRTLIDLGGPSDFGQSIAVDTQDQVVVAGYSYQGSTGYDFAVAKLDTSGELDNTFGSNGRVTTDFRLSDFASDDFGQNVAFDAQGRILVIGSSFTYSDSGDSYASDIEIARYLTGANAAPAAHDSTLTTAEDNSVAGTLSATDGDSPTLTYRIASGAVHGTVTITNINTGAYTYTPAADYSGPDMFTFNANDGSLDSSVATVVITVRPVNDAPTAVTNIASVTVNEGQTAANAGTYFDVDLGDSDNITASVGTVTKNGTNGGTWSWSWATTDGPAQSQTVTITAGDGHGGVATTAFALIVDNVAPTATFNALSSIVYGNSLIVGLASPIDSSIADIAAGLHYTFAISTTNSSPLTAARYESSSTTASASYSQLSAGTYFSFARIIDADNGFTEYSQQVTVTPARSWSRPIARARRTARVFTAFTGSLVGGCRRATESAIGGFSSTGAPAAAAVGAYAITATLTDPGGKLVNYTISNHYGTLSVVSLSGFTYILDSSAAEH